MPDGFAALERELQRDPRSKKFLDLARGYQKVGRLADALGVCESGLANNPNMAQARVLQAQLLLASGNLQAASASVQKALLVLPDNVTANHLAADIFWGLGDSTRALKHYQIVQLFEPGREGVAERIRNITSPPQPEVVPATEVDAILGPPRESESPTPPEIVPEKAEEALPIQEADLSIPEVEEPSGPPETGSSEAVDAPPSPTAISEESGSDSLEGAPPIWEEPEAREVPAVPEIPEVEVSRVVDVFPSAPEDGNPDGAKNRDGVEAGPEFNPLGEGFLDLGEALEWPGQVPEVLVPDRPVPEEPLTLPMRTREPATILGRANDAAGPDGSPGDSLNTLTLARLYEQQGYPEKAVEVYQRLLIRNPDDPQVLERIQALRYQMERGAVEPELVDQEEIRRALRQRSIRALNEWLGRMREERHVS